MSSSDIKENVKKHYAGIAVQPPSPKASSCCGPTPCGCDSRNADLSDAYSRLPGYVPDADLGLGCGIPVDIAGIKPGDTVLDLGSGGGNDVFVARHLVGETGRVIGVDMTEEMIRKAESNKSKLGYGNVEFRRGEIEDLPVEANTIDVVISNCVLNLVPNKTRAFAEIYRVLKPGGHFSISDIVLTGELPPALAADVAMYAECVAGALQKEDYLARIRAAGFSGVEVQREQRVPMPEETLLKFGTTFEAAHFTVWSITVVGQKPGN